MTGRQPPKTIGVVIYLLVLSACGSTMPNRAVSQPSPTAPVPSISAGLSTTITLSEADKGRSIHAKQGDTVIVNLHSTYWQLSAPSGTALVAEGNVDAGPGVGCPHYPGSGCGTITQHYVVARPGTAVLSAGRKSCGEALACAPDQASWSITVIVD
jgi:hypothetical protein